MSCVSVFVCECVCVHVCVACQHGCLQTSCCEVLRTLAAAAAAAAAVSWGCKVDALVGPVVAQRQGLRQSCMASCMGDECMPIGCICELSRDSREAWCRGMQGSSCSVCWGFEVLLLAAFSYTDCQPKLILSTE